MESIWADQLKLEDTKFIICSTQLVPLDFQRASKGCKRLLEIASERLSYSYLHFPALKDKKLDIDHASIEDTANCEVA